LLPPFDALCCCVELMPLVDELLDELLVVDDDVLEFDVDDELVLVSSELVEVVAFVLLEAVLVLCVAACATPAISAAVTATPATAAVPPATVARRTSRSALCLVSMQNTIGSGVSAPPHSSVKETSRGPGNSPTGRRTRA
jgi:hypothetical protein